MMLSRLFILIFLSTFLFTSCDENKKGCTDARATNYDSDAKEDDGTCDYADPAGTKVDTLGSTCALNHGIDFSTGVVSCQTCDSTNMTGTDIIFTVDAFKTTTTLMNCFGDNDLGIVGVGQVCCLGEIYNVPSIGYSTSSAAARTGGYVVRTREGNYARFWVRDWTYNASGGSIRGAIIKWQYPFN